MVEGKSDPSAKQDSLRRRVGFLLGLELRLEYELVLTRVVVRIGGRDGAEGVVAVLLVTAVVVRDEEVWRVGDVEALCAELEVDPFRDREVLEDGEVYVTEVGSKQRVALRGSNGSEGLRGEVCRVEELG